MNVIYFPKDILVYIIVSIIKYVLTSFMLLVRNE